MTPARGSGTDKVAPPPPWLPQVPGRCSELQRGRVGLSWSQPGQGHAPRGLDRGSCWLLGEGSQAQPWTSTCSQSSLARPGAHPPITWRRKADHRPPPEPSHPLMELCPRNLAWGTQGIWLHLRHPSPPPAQPGGRFQVAKETGLTLHIL